jgi:hypothetical protein
MAKLYDVDPFRHVMYNFITEIEKLIGILFIIIVIVLISIFWLNPSTAPLILKHILNTYTLSLPRSGLLGIGPACEKFWYRILTRKTKYGTI